MIDGRGENILPDSRAQLAKVTQLLTAITAELAAMSGNNATQKKLTQIKKDLTRLFETLSAPVDSDRMDVD